jgi:SAM-dependent methyltransferase
MKHHAMPSHELECAPTALYDHGAGSYDARLRAQPVSLKRLRTVEAPLRRLALSASHVLDLGCGTGRFAAGLGTRNVVGIDISMGMLREAIAKGVRVARGDAHALPFASGAFDLVVAANAAFRHLGLDQALAESARVLRPGGWLACHQYAARVWSLRRPFSRPAARHARDLLTIAGFERAAQAHGLWLVEVQLWRGLRFWPHLVRVPGVLAMRLWDQGVFVFERR